VSLIKDNKYWFAIDSNPLRLEECARWLCDKKCGAMNIFIGFVREDCEENRVIVNLNYESYEQPALKIFSKIADEATELWPATKKIAIHHRIGCVGVGEASVLIGAVTPHRKDSFEIVEYLIDNVKKRALIWKYDVWEGGGSWSKSAYMIKGI